MKSTDSPRLVASFETDANGKPEFTPADGLRHYRVVFEIENAPEDVYAATFELDPSYYDPRRTLRPDSDGNIRLEATAYGDYDVKVRLRTKEGEVPLSRSLRAALRDSRAGMAAPNPGIDEAIEYISNH